jgi:hypothetical protein
MAAEQGHISIHIIGAIIQQNALLESSIQGNLAVSIELIQSNSEVNMASEDQLGENDDEQVGLILDLPAEQMQDNSDQDRYFLPENLLQDIINPRNIVGNQEPPQINLNLQVGFMVHQDILVEDPIFESFTMQMEPQPQKSEMLVCSDSGVKTFHKWVTLRSKLAFL